MPKQMIPSVAIFFQNRAKFEDLQMDLDDSELRGTLVQFKCFELLSDAELEMIFRQYSIPALELIVADAKMDINRMTTLQLQDLFKVYHAQKKLLFPHIYEETRRMISISQSFANVSLSTRRPSPSSPSIPSIPTGISLGGTVHVPPTLSGTSTVPSSPPPKVQPRWILGLPLGNFAQQRTEFLLKFNSKILLTKPTPEQYLVWRPWFINIMNDQSIYLEAYELVDRNYLLVLIYQYGLLIGDPHFELAREWDHVALLTVLDFHFWTGHSSASVLDDLKLIKMKPINTVYHPNHRVIYNTYYKEFMVYIILNKTAVANVDSSLINKQFYTNLSIDPS